MSAKSSSTSPIHGRTPALPSPSTHRPDSVLPWLRNAPRAHSTRPVATGLCAQSGPLPRIPGLVWAMSSAASPYSRSRCASLQRAVQCSAGSPSSGRPRFRETAGHVCRGCARGNVLGGGPGTVQEWSGNTAQFGSVVHLKGCGWFQAASLGEAWNHDGIKLLRESHVRTPTPV